MKRTVYTITLTLLFVSFANTSDSKKNPVYPSVKSAINPGKVFTLKKKKKQKKSEDSNTDRKAMEDLEWFYFTFEKDFGFSNKSREAVEVVKTNLSQMPEVSESVEITAPSEFNQERSAGKEKMNIPNTIWNIEEIGAGSVY